MKNRALGMEQLLDVSSKVIQVSSIITKIGLFPNMTGYAV